MFSHTEQNANNIAEQALKITALLKEKYPNLQLSISYNTNTLGCINIKFLNAVFGIEHPNEDPVNEQPIQYLRLHNSKITKSRHERHAYWSYSVATIKHTELKNIIEGLEMMPNFDPAATSFRLIINY